MKSFNSYLIENNLEKSLSAKVRKAITSADAKIYQIGGAVRDEILGKVSKDLLQIINLPKYH